MTQTTLEIFKIQIENLCLATLEPVAPLHRIVGPTVHISHFDAHVTRMARHISCYVNWHPGGASTLMALCQMDARSTLTLVYFHIIILHVRNWFICVVVRRDGEKFRTNKESEINTYHKFYYAMYPLLPLNFCLFRVPFHQRQVHIMYTVLYLCMLYVCCDYVERNPFAPLLLH